ncbi:F-box-like domain superfamily [Arabidopsis suecica]|uniref:F-box-like domain superfamily n=1 Tax=Arabidopsis suecica TaxID=45249 RepID=A0A8T2FCW0_ARASU|nr:F-box-like domain superfamily [Arabidopsis suecica]
MEQLNPASMDCLPDELLVEILSSLTTKQAVSTSLLSKRWKTLYSLVHNLDIDDYILFHREDGYHRYRPDIQKSFEDFVERTLAFRGHIKTFSLKSRELYAFGLGVDVVNRWICNALERGVSELHLCINSQFELPYKFFTSTTLVMLSLGRGIDCPRIPPDTSLPVLKILFLDSIRFKDDKFSDVFLAACPVLEELTIHDMNYPYVISSKSIKKLSLTIDNSYYNCLIHNHSSILRLDTPNVVDLYYSDLPRRKAPHCHLDSLAKVTLDLHYLRYGYQKVQNYANVKNIISEICNVKTLHLTSSAVEVISVCRKDGLPVFNNLVELMFSSRKRHRKVLPLLLERSPNLETLILSDLYRYTYGRRHRFVGIQIPANNKIKMLSFMQYQGSATELKHISHLLLKMECLEVVKVYLATEMNDLKKMQLTEDVVKLPAASSKVKIQVMGS